MTYLATGEKYQDCELLLTDTKTQTIVLARGDVVKTLELDSSEGQRTGQPPVARETSLQNITTWLNFIEAHVKRLPGYTPIDLEYEKTISPENKKLIDKVRADPRNKGYWICASKTIVAGQPGMKIHIVKSLPSGATRYQRLFPGLNSEDWRRMDERFGRLFMEFTFATKEERPITRSEFSR
jgi:hypothetical protein